MTLPAATTPILPSAISLARDEVPIEIWQPRFSVFLGKLAFVSCLTALLLGHIFTFSYTPYGFLLWAVSVLVAAAIYAFIFDDVFEWRARRDDSWVLTNQRLIFYNPNDDASPAYMPLQTVKMVRRWMFWGVQLKLVPRDAITMLFLKNRKTICTTLRAALSQTRAPDQNTPQSEALK